MINSQRRTMRKLFSLLMIMAMVITSLSIPQVADNAYATINDDSCLTFTAGEAGSTITFGWREGSNVQIKVSSTSTNIDGAEASSTDWMDYQEGTTIKLVNAGDTVKFKAETIRTRNWTGQHFSMTGKIAASGDVTSLTNNGECGAASLNYSCYEAMFSGCTSLTSAPNLPSTSLAPYCYEFMFHGCTGLTTAPTLPATKTELGCYADMFYGCTGLTIAPELPATQLELGCYADMFYGCTGLTEAPTLNATQLAESCYSGMFTGCTSLTTAPALPATTLAKSCYNAMFAQCKNLTTAPSELPATETSVGCYELMFNGCTSLTNAPKMNIETITDGCFHRMFNNCRKLYVTTTTDADPTWTFSTPTSASNWNTEMISDVASGSLNAVEAGGSYNVSAPTICKITLWPNNSIKGQTKRTISTQAGSYTLPSCPFTAPTGKEFAGWATSTDGPAIEGTTIDVSTDTSLYATWKTQSVKYTVIFNNNGDTETMKPVTAEAGAYTLPECAFKAPEGKEFAGWAYTADGDIITTSTIDLSADITLYAKWKNVIEDELTFTAKQADSTVEFEDYEGSNVQYSLNGTSWQSYEDGTLVTLTNVGDTISFRGHNVNLEDDGYFDIEGAVAASGDVTSLINGVGGVEALTDEYCFYGLFLDCEGLVDASELRLPSTTLSKGCYYEMFDGCKNLKTAPKLPATTLAKECYSCMFEECTSLTNAPALPATTLANECYDCMFEECTSLTKAPELNATVMTEGCYNGMFAGCSSLTKATELPATTLAPACYNGMFYGCTSLVAGPKELPATQLDTACYANMFRECTSLTKAPTMKPTSMKYASCFNMFMGCAGLKVATTTDAANATWTFPATSGTSWSKKMIDGVAEGSVASVTDSTSYLVTSAYTRYNVSFNSNTGGGTMDTEVVGEGLYTLPDCGFTAPEGKTFDGWATSTDGAKITSTTINVATDTTLYARWRELSGTPLTFKAAEANSTVTFKYYSGTVKYSTNGGASWTNYTEGTTVTLTDIGDTVMFVGENVTTTASEHFGMTGTIDASGDVTALTNLEGGDADLTDSCYQFMFGGCAALRNVSGLTINAKSMPKAACMAMFYNCTNMVNAPTLSATTLDTGCYMGMFSNCSSLVSAPALPATTLADYCYDAMFYGCTSLKSAPALPATKLAPDCYEFMFGMCTSLKSAPALPATTLADYCYRKMFYGCSGLTSTPALPATTLAKGCYCWMFEKCTSLTSVPALQATTLADYCYVGMFRDCSNIKLYEVGNGTAWGIPASATNAESAFGETYTMFKGAGAFTGNPTVGTSYYYHNFIYTVSGNTIVATCDYCQDSATLTLNAADTTYNGKAVTASVSGTSQWISAGLEVPSAVTYYTNPYLTARTDKDNGAACEGGAPVNAGTYYAVVTAEGQTICTRFTIAKKQLKIKADNKISYLGADLEQLTYTAEGLVGNDKIWGALKTDADKDTAGTYEITQGTLYAGENYEISFMKGTYTVDQAKSDAVASKVITRARAYKKSIRLTWNETSEEVTYKVYFSRCGKAFKCVKTTTAAAFNKTGLKAGTNYRAYVASYDKNGNLLSKSPVIHCMTTGGKYANATKVTALDSATLTVGNTTYLSARIAKKASTKALLWKNHCAKLRYFSADTDVATVDANGNVTAVGKGATNIYSVAPSGACAVTVVTVE